ncbi:hypothetical protein [Maridesulfovibrio sp.]|uniref:hypothetical protein n=1 Tax=Maridesulfovibrio sp. TaxID=2795000 RepID=UPI003BAC4650
METATKSDHHCPLLYPDGFDMGITCPLCRKFEADRQEDEKRIPDAGVAAFYLDVHDTGLAHVTINKNRIR